MSPEDNAYNEEIIDCVNEHMNNMAKALEKLKEHRPEGLSDRAETILAIVYIFNSLHKRLGCFRLTDILSEVDCGIFQAIFSNQSAMMKALAAVSTSFS